MTFVKRPATVAAWRQLQRRGRAMQVVSGVALIGTDPLSTGFAPARMAPCPVLKF